MIKRRAPIRKVSKAKAKSDNLYRRRVKVWLEGKVCAVFGLPATEVHHSRGRLLQDVEREMPDEKILQSNMRCNKWDKIVINTNSWKICQPIEKNDVILEYAP